MERERFDPADRPPLVPEVDDAGLVVSFAVGPSGVGPVMGFGTDDFFPVAPAADLGTDHGSVDPSESGDTGKSPADRSAEVTALSVDEPTPGAEARSASRRGRG